VYEPDSPVYAAKPGNVTGAEKAPMPVASTPLSVTPSDPTHPPTGAPNTLACGANQAWQASL
jgi:hypothetical protein